jgi:hypothetical protein
MTHKPEKPKGLIVPLTPIVENFSVASDSESETIPEFAHQEQVAKSFLNAVRLALIEAVGPDEQDIPPAVFTEFINPKNIDHETLAAGANAMDSDWIIRINAATFDNKHTSEPIVHVKWATHNGKLVYEVLDSLKNHFKNEDMPGIKTFMYLFTRRKIARELFKDMPKGHALIFNGIVFRALGDWYTLCLYIDPNSDELCAGSVKLDEEWDETMSYVLFPTVRTR